MKVTSKEISEELYKLSGWESTYWYHYKGGKVYPISRSDGMICAAYDLGFLIRKLPGQIIEKNLQYDLELKKYDLTYGAYYNHDSYDHGALSLYSYEESTPEDAVALLAISLIKEGVIK